MLYFCLSQAFQNKWTIWVIKHAYTLNYGEGKCAHLSQQATCTWAKCPRHINIRFCCARDTPGARAGLSHLPKARPGAQQASYRPEGTCATRQTQFSGQAGFPNWGAGGRRWVPLGQCCSKAGPCGAHVQTHPAGPPEANPFSCVYASKEMAFFIMEIWGNSRSWQMRSQKDKGIMVFITKK